MCNFAFVGPILHSRKNLQKQFSFVYAQVLKNELTPLHVDYHTTLVLVAVFYFMLIYHTVCEATTIPLSNCHALLSIMSSCNTGHPFIVSS